MNFRGKIMRSSAAIFYLLIGLKIVIMVSPFVAYFYAEMGRIERWSVRTLQKKIDRMLDERTARSCSVSKESGQI